MNLEICSICHPFRSTRILSQEIRALLTERGLPLPNDISLRRHLDLATIFDFLQILAMLCVCFHSCPYFSNYVEFWHRSCHVCVFAVCVLAWKLLEFLRPRAKLPKQARQCVLGLHVSPAISASPARSTWFPTCWHHCEAPDLQPYRATPSKIFQD